MSARIFRGAPGGARTLLDVGRRRGFTLLEVLLVVALIGILTSIGFVFARDLVPQYRTRGAAMDFANWVSHCRTTAMTTGRQCRILMVEYDDNLVDLDTNYGRYLVQVEISSDSSGGGGGGGSSSGDGGSAEPVALGLGWDTLPIDTYGDTTDDNMADGIIDLSSGDTRLRRVAIADWGDIGGPGTDNDNAIVFDTRGFVANPASDFDANGKITVTFVNKVAESRGAPDRWEVHISRAGVAKLDSSRRDSDDNFTGGGTATGTAYDSTGSFGAP